MEQHRIKSRPSPDGEMPTMRRNLRPRPRGTERTPPGNLLLNLRPLDPVDQKRGRGTRTMNQAEASRRIERLEEDLARIEAEQKKIAEMLTRWKKILNRVLEAQD